MLLRFEKQDGAVMEYSASGAHDNVASSASTLLLLMGSVNSWPVGVGDPLIALLFLVFLFLVPILALNLLIAMLNRCAWACVCVGVCVVVCVCGRVGYALDTAPC